MLPFNIQPLAQDEPSTSDDTVYIKDLPKQGCLSGIDLKFLIANLTHANGNPAANILDCINKIEIVRNGDERIFSMSGHELFQHYWTQDGKPPFHEFNGRNSEEAFVVFPIRFGRFMGDTQFGLNLAKASNVQLLIDYALNPVGDNDDGDPTGFKTGTTVINAMMHITPPDKTVPFQACIGLRQYYTHATTASETKRMDLPRQNPLLGMGVYNHKSGTSQSATVASLNLELNNGDKIPIRGNWYDLVRIQAQQILDNNLRFMTLWTTGKTLDLLTNWIQSIQVRPMYNTPTNTAQNCIRAPEQSVTGGLLTMAAGPAIEIDLDASPVVTAAANAINQPYDMLVQSYPDRYVYLPMADKMNMTDITQPNLYSLIEAVVKEGTTGSATESLIVEELRAA